MTNYNEILKHWNETHAEEVEEIQFWMDDFITEDADTPEELAFQLTAYEQWGCIDFDKWLDNQLKIKLDELDDSELVSLHNETCGFDDYIWDDLSEMLEGYEPERAINCIWYGNYQGGTIGYFQFDGYANVVEDYPENLIDKQKCVETLHDQMPELSDEAKNVLIQMTIELVKAGY